MQINYRRSQLP